LKGQMYEY